MIRRVLTFAFLALAVLLLAFTSACTTVSSGPDPDLRTINVSGTGTAYGSPDVATADIAVVTRGEEVKKASDENTRLMATVLSSLKGLGVADQDIRTSDYRITIEQAQNADGTVSDQREYVINNTVTVKFRDLSKVGEGLQAAITAGANQISNITFGIEDTAKLAAEARAEAMADALSRAEQLAQAAGVKIDKPYTISESYGYSPATVRSFDAGAAAPAAPVPVEAGQVSVQVDVSVTYLIK